MRGARGPPCLKPSLDNVGQALVKHGFEINATYPVYKIPAVAALLSVALFICARLPGLLLRSEVGHGLGWIKLGVPPGAFHSAKYICREALDHSPDALSDR